MNNSGAGKDAAYVSKLNPKITKNCPICFVMHGPAVRDTLQKLDSYDGNIKITDRPFELITHVCVKCGYVAKFFSDVAVKEWQTPVEEHK